LVGVAEQNMRIWREGSADRQVPKGRAASHYRRKRFQHGKYVMVLSYDHVHPCPRCGSAWRAQVLSVLAGGSDDGSVRYWAAVSAGNSADSRCELSPSEVAAFREMRRRLGWDRWLTMTD